jgi:hypothetical protein
LHEEDFVLLRGFSSSFPSTLGFFFLGRFGALKGELAGWYEKNPGMELTFKT